MAVATGTLSRRQNQENKVAAKSKRDKIILAVGGLVLVAVLAFELPSILNGSSSSTPPAPATPAPTAAVSSTAVPAGTSSVAVVRRELAVIAKLPSKDPFQAQLGTGAGSSTQLPSLAKEPRVRTSHFVVKDPFKVLIGAPANHCGGCAARQGTGGHTRDRSRPSLGRSPPSSATSSSCAPSTARQRLGRRSRGLTPRGFPAPRSSIRRATRRSGTATGSST